MARKGDIEIEIPWWLFAGMIAGGYLLYKHSTAGAQPVIPPYYLPPGVAGDGLADGGWEQIYPPRAHRLWR